MFAVLRPPFFFNFLVEEEETFPTEDNVPTYNRLRLDITIESLEFGEQKLGVDKTAVSPHYASCTIAADRRCGDTASSKRQSTRRAMYFARQT